MQQFQAQLQDDLSVLAGSMEATAFFTAQLPPLTLSPSAAVGKARQRAARPSRLWLMVAGKAVLAQEESTGHCCCPGAAAGQR